MAERTPNASSSDVVSFQETELSRPTAVDWLFRVFSLLAVALLALLLVDLFILGAEPFNPSIVPYSLRIVLGVIGGIVGLAISILVLWRVPGNPVGRLLLLWIVGAIGWQFSYNFGSTDLNDATFFVFAFFFGALVLTALPLLLLHFPSGKVFPPSLSPFVPLYIAIRVIGTLLTVASTNPSLYNHATNPFFVPALERYNAVLESTVGINGGLSFMLGLVVGIYAQYGRYRQARMLERQQIKWFVWMGLILAVSVSAYISVHLLVINSFAELVPLIDFPFFILVVALPPLAIGAAILRYGLWDVNLLIGRTVLYASLTAILAAIFSASAVIVNQLAAGLLGSESSAPAALVSTILIVAVFQPLRHELENRINERYFPENRELSRDFLEFSGEYRALIPLEEMLDLIPRRICGIFSAGWGWVAMYGDGARFNESGAWNIDNDQIPEQVPPGNMLTSWGRARSIRNDNDEAFLVLIPLYITRVRGDSIVGILGLGPRKGGQGYSRNDLRGLTRFGGEAGKVLYSYWMRASRKNQ